ncbi:MAG: hypothetical protein Phog2KO_29140 [Phototrophicaceae bacterium]
MTETNFSADDSGQSGGGATEGSGVAYVIGFITEFNANAAIFNEVVGSLLNDTNAELQENRSLATTARSKADTAYNNGLKLMGEVNMLKARVTRLDGAIGADNPNFQTRDRTTADGTGFTE